MGADTFRQTLVILLYILASIPYTLGVVVALLVAGRADLIVSVVLVSHLVWLAGFGVLAGIQIVRGE